MDDDFINYIPFRQGEFGPYVPRARPVEVPTLIEVKVEERGEEERVSARRATMGVVPKWPEDPDDLLVPRLRRARNESPVRAPKGEPLEEGEIPSGIPSRENTPPRRDNTIYVRPLFALAPGPPPPASPPRPRRERSSLPFSSFANRPMSGRRDERQRSQPRRNDVPQPPPLFAMPPPRSIRNDTVQPPPLFSMPPPRSIRNDTVQPPPLFRMPPPRSIRNDTVRPPPLFSPSAFSLPPPRSMRSPSRRDMRDGPPRRTRSRSPLPPRSSFRAASVASYYGHSRAQSAAARSPRRRRRNDDSSASIIHGPRERGEVQVLNNPVFPKREKKEDPDGDDDVRIVGGTSRRSMSRRARSRHSRSLSRNPFDGYIANIRKRPGDDDDPVCFCPDRNAAAAPRDEPVTITVLSELEKAPFRVVMLDPTYGLYPLEAVRVERPEGDTREVKRYFFEFQPRMYGPHIVLLTMADFFRVHSVRVHGTGPPPQRRRQEGGRPPLISLDVQGVPEAMRTLFHAARPRRDDEKFVDPRQVLEQLLG